MSFRILSLGGGGIRGIFQAVYLRELSKNFQRPLTKIFQMMAGTSTGALIALGLALELHPSKLVDLFNIHGSTIFGNKKWFSLVRKGARYSTMPLRKVLQETYGDKCLKDCKIPVIICSTVLNRYQHRIFTNMKRRGEVAGDSEMRVVDVALASCAAPTYFPSFHFEGNAEVRTYVDGGMWANNPALIATILSHWELSMPFEDMRLVNLGNGKFPSGYRADRYDSARPIWMVEDILELMFSSQNTAADDLSKSLIGERNVLTLEGNLEQPIDLDDVKTAVRVLPALAEGEARNSVLRFKDFLFSKPRGTILTADDVELGVRVGIVNKPQQSLYRPDEGVVKWNSEMNGFCGRSAVVVSVNDKGIPSVQLDIDSGKNVWAVEWLVAAE